MILLSIQTKNPSAVKKSANSDIKNKNHFFRNVYANAHQTKNDIADHRLRYHDIVCKSGFILVLRSPHKKNLNMEKNADHMAVSIRKNIRVLYFFMGIFLLNKY